LDGSAHLDPHPDKHAAGCVGGRSAHAQPDVRRRRAGGGLVALGPGPGEPGSASAIRWLHPDPAARGKSEKVVRGRW
jgi:hypothetical protein